MGPRDSLVSEGNRKLAPTNGSGMFISWRTLTQGDSAAEGDFPSVWDALTSDDCALVGGAWEAVTCGTNKLAPWESVTEAGPP